MFKRFLWLFVCYCFFIGSAQQSKNYIITVNKSLNESYISPYVRLDSLKNNPFTSFSLQIKGDNINRKIANVYFEDDEAKWKELKPDRDHVEENAWYALQFIHKTLTTTRIKIDFRDQGNLRSLKLNFYLPESTNLLLKKYNIKLGSAKNEKAQSDCGCPRPETISRSLWCPDGSCIENQNPVTTDVKFLIVHHTAGSNTISDWAAVVRSIWNYHVNTRGWDDIGYNFLFDANGKIYEGRSDDTRGAHFSGHNSETSGLALMGTFTSVDPSTLMLYALEDFLTWKSCDKGINPLATAYHASSNLILNTISGHRDGGITECPGDKVYEQLSMIRNSVSSQLNSCNLGVNDAFSSHFTLFPNPIEANLNIISSVSFTSLEFVLFDCKGRLIFKKEISHPGAHITMDLSKIQPGLYFMELRSENKRTYFKILKK